MNTEGGGHPRARSILTRRGAGLLLFAIAFVAVGITQYVLTEPTEAARDQLRFAFSLLPPEVWGAGFIAVGLFGVVSAFSVDPPARDRWGWNALVAWSSWWSFCYLAGIAEGASLRGFTGAIIYAAFAGAFYIIAGLPNRVKGSPW